MIDLVTFSSFACVLLLGLMALIVQDVRSRRPAARIKLRVLQSLSAQDDTLAPVAGSRDTPLFKVERESNAISRWLAPRLTRLRTVAGASGLRIVIGAAIAGGLTALTVNCFIPLPALVRAILLSALPLVAAAQAYRILVSRFHRRFLNGFPDLIDMIVRAVRAGVPVTHVIGAASKECAEPLRHEFQLMGDSLQLGIDLSEVLTAAMRRIEITDFSFFCVCLMLQRETGGQLGETLENLAAIVRSRSEIRMKTKALTAEARITTKILSAIPIVIVLMLYEMNRPYIMVLFERPAGQRLLTFAALSVVIGIAVINRMSKLNTSR
ncbi:type II secretion system F family protein [Paraburkholderia sp. SARCC-3016]|uniref:type II secretion system F family protein n=1 Tax=Paraburkholderia sp. SARCC-3016 TaxID=3058611 RepID=UPI002809FAA6|nr:type II secretion system F family protein [Paraburkholderia sp. SARCC-3016]MDQ7981731.1 type II secretion system F family protein [Paraburkholderia sp. SARCC-3016]